MPVPAPPIDQRSLQDLVTQTERLLQQHTSWRPPAQEHDAGQALVRIFARLAELVIDRLNQVPAKNFLAFLDMIGLELLPPQPARVPLTFTLATGSTDDARVPARTQVAATPLEGETEPVIFETERDLIVTRSQLIAAFTRAPRYDQYSDHTPTATRPVGDATFAVFQGSQPIEHRLYLGNCALFGSDVPKDVTLRILPVEGQAAWPTAVQWAYYDGVACRPLTVSAAPRQLSSGWQIVLRNVPAIPRTVINGHTSCWLCASLTIPLPHGTLTRGEDGVITHLRHDNLPPEVSFIAGELTPGQSQLPATSADPFFPFGADLDPAILYVSCYDAFSKPDASITIHPGSTGIPAATTLTWQYWNGSAWDTLEVDPATLTFSRPGAWAEGDLDGAARLWLRARIEGTGDEPLSDAQRAIWERLTLSYTWPVPRISTIQARVVINRANANLLPDLAFFNQLPIDLSKDFFPFGEQPRFNDTLYLASAEAFARPGAKVTLTIALTSTGAGQGPPPPAQSEDVHLRWEFWNSDKEQWDLLGESGPGTREPSIEDGTNAFLKDGSVTFTCPTGMGAVEVNGQLAHWIRARIVGGGYGSAARYEEVVDENGQKTYRLVPADFKPPSIKSIVIGYTYDSSFVAVPDILTENDFVIAPRPGTPLFNPYTPTSDTHPTLYLGFERPGAALGFANKATALYFSVAEIPYSGEASPWQADSEPAAVVWEYWNGSRWTRLGTRDETQNFTRRGLITFIGPPDFRRRTEFTREAFWLRARLDRGGYLIPPQLHNVLTNTIWSTHTRTLTNETLGSSNGEPGQVFRTTRVPVLPGQRIEVREPEMPSADERSMIEAEEGADAISTVTGRNDRPADIWVRWHHVRDFYASGPRSRHYTLDRVTGAIRFGDGQHGLVPPQGRANLRVAWYQTGGGSQGNRPANTITQLKSAVPYIDSVTNWSPAGGGANQETLEAIKERGPKTLRHRDRSVAISDFEDLALEASTSVARVKGLPAENSQMAGTVELIIVPRSAAAQPIPSLELLGRVEEHITARRSPTVTVRVVGPDWKRVSVTAEVVPLAPDAATDVQNAVIERLNAFLHPLTGGLDSTGWPFGRKPYRSDLFALIERTPGVDHVRRLIITEVDERGTARPERFLVYSGEHQITMVSSTDET